MSKIFIVSVFLALCATNTQGQDSLKTKKSTANAGIFFGANMVQFYRTNSEALKLPFKQPVWQWQVGLGVDIIDTKKYGLRYELLYNNKGASESFSDGLSTKIASQASLSYVQCNLFPVIYKPLGNRKFNPYIALGGYYAYLVSSKYTTQVNTTPSFTDSMASTITLKQDYGVDVAIGVYLKKISLEYRIEAGLLTILNQQKTLSTIKNKTHSIILSFR